MPAPQSSQGAKPVNEKAMLDPSSNTAAAVNTWRNARRSAASPAGNWHRKLPTPMAPATLAAPLRLRPDADALAALTDPRPASNTPPLKAISTSNGTVRMASHVPACPGGGSMVEALESVSVTKQQHATRAAAPQSTGRTPQPRSAGTNGPSASAAPSEVW